MKVSNFHPAEVEESPVSIQMFQPLFEAFDCSRAYFTDNGNPSRFFLRFSNHKKIYIFYLANPTALKKWRVHSTNCRFDVFLKKRNLSSFSVCELLFGNLTQNERLENFKLMQKAAQNKELFEEAFTTYFFQRLEHFCEKKISPLVEIRDVYFEVVSSKKDDQFLNAKLLFRGKDYNYRFPFNNSNRTPTYYKIDPLVFRQPSFKQRVSLANSMVSNLVIHYKKNNEYFHKFGPGWFYEECFLADRVLRNLIIKKYSPPNLK